ncbi:MAG: hypothetical protein AB7K73_07880 [Gammaproteobacteria bacterium]
MSLCANRQRLTPKDKRKRRGFALIQGQPTIANRGFDKTLSRTFAGKVIRRG